MSSWAEGLTPLFLHQLLPVCDARAVAHLRATCSAWRRDCSRHLTNLEMTPLPLDEFRKLADIFPNIRSLTISRGRADVRGCWIQTDHIQALTSFHALSAVTLESITYLRSEELCQLQRMDKLRSLSLPSARLKAEQQQLLLNSPRLTSLTMNSEHYLQKIPFAVCGGLQIVQLPSISSWAYHDDDSLSCQINHLASIPSISLALNVRDDGKAVERLLLCPNNVRHVLLRVEYGEWTPAFLEAIRHSSVIVDLSLHTCFKQEHVECSAPDSWMNTLTSITSLKLSGLGPSMLTSAVCMDWLLALDFSRLRCAPANGFGFISQLTSLTSLKVSSEYVDRISWACLFPLKALASCSLEAISCYTGATGHPMVMQHGSDVLFHMSTLTQLQMNAAFPEFEPMPHYNLMNVSSNLCRLEFVGPGQVTDYCMDVIARMTCLTKLLLIGKSFPLRLSSISTLRWLKELRLLSSSVSAADLAFVCQFRYLACLQLRSLDVTDDMFVHAARLDKLTTLDVQNCPQISDTIFLHLAQLVSLRELRIRDCLGMSHHFKFAGELPSVLTCLRRLRTVSIP